MPATFDNVNLVITLPSHGGAGQQEINVERDLYSDWKEWVLLDSQRQGASAPAFATKGGDAVTASLDSGSYFFLNNGAGWRIRPYEEDGEYTLIGNLVAQDSTLPLTIPTIGAYTALINGIQPITQTTTVNAFMATLALNDNVIITSLTDILTEMSTDTVTIEKILKIVKFLRVKP